MPLNVKAANHPANGPLTVERIVRVTNELKRMLTYQNGGDITYVIADSIKALDELLEIRRLATVDEELRCNSKVIGNN